MRIYPLLAAAGIAVLAAGCTLPGRAPRTPAADVPRLDVSRFPDSCAFEGATPEVSYEEGIRQMEADPWVKCALVVGVVTGTYSTIYIAGALIVDWTNYVEGRLRRPKKAVAKA